MANWKDWQLNKEHRQNLLRQAEQARLANSLSPQPRPARAPLAALLARLSAQWEQLQKREQVEVIPAIKVLDL